MRRILCCLFPFFLEFLVLSALQKGYTRYTSECTLSLSKQACPLFTKKKKKKGITLTSTQNLYCNTWRYIKLQGLNQKGKSKEYCFGEAFINDKLRYQTIHYRRGFLSLPVLNIFLGVKNRIFCPCYDILNSDELQFVGN